MSTVIPEENVIIIGGGPSGLAAAIYTSRAGLHPLLFAGSPPGGQLTLTSEVENYPGYESILGSELIEKMRKQAQKFETRIIDENVLSVDFSQKPLRLTVSAGTMKKLLGVKELQSEQIKYEIPAKSVIISTGAKALWLGIESEQRMRGKGVSACATCDGFFFRNKIVAVIGGGDTAMEEALTLTKFAKKVYIIHRRNLFRASKVMQERVFTNPQIEIIWNAQVMEVKGTIKVEGISIAPVDNNLQDTENTVRTRILNRKEDISIDGLFVAIGHKPDTELFSDKIILDTKGYVMTSQRAAFEYAKQKVLPVQLKEEKVDITKFNLSFQTATSATGVFAAGDCVDHVYRQAATAAGLGVAAALDAEKWLAELV